MTDKPAVTNDLSDPKSAVAEHADQIWSDIQGETRKRLLFLHYVTGPREWPYTLRRSTLRVPEERSVLALFAEKALKRRRKKKTTERIQKLHDRVFDEYIKYLDRDSTLLKWTIDTLLLPKRTPESSIGGLTIVKSDDAGVGYVCGEKVSGLQDKVNSLFEWRLSMPEANLLSQVDCTKAFFVELYSNAVKSKRVEQAEADRSSWHEHFELARAHLFGKWMAEGASKKKAKQDWEQELKERMRVWKRLPAMQSALLYFTVHAGAKMLHKRSCTVVVRYDALAAKDKAVALAVAIVTPPLGKNELDSVGAKLKSLLQTVHTLSVPYVSCQGIDDGPWGLAVKLGEALSLTADQESELRRPLANAVVAASPYQFRVEAYVFWTLLIAANLRSSIHEGESLDFFFVCGELSDFRDHRNTLVRRLSKKDTGVLSLPTCASANAIQKAAKVAAKLLEREHFPWFERGRHALLWDIGQANPMAPVAIVSLNNSTWTEIITARFRRETSAEVPNCLVSFAEGHSGHVGLVSISRGHGKEKTKVSELVRRKDEGWELRGERATKTDLLDHLHRALHPLAAANRKKLAEESARIILRVADDPTRGGTVLFVDPGDAVKWKSMGEPWRLDEITEDDTVALIGHDGATIRTIGSREWEHRRLLTPEPQMRLDLDAFERYVVAREDEDNPEEGGLGREWPLQNKGSRRWSAAMIAFHPEVRAVVVISQDGDIHLWYVRREGEGRQIKEVTMVELAQDATKSDLRTTAEPAQGATKQDHLMFPAEGERERDESWTWPPKVSRPKPKKGVKKKRAKGARP